MFVICKIRERDIGFISCGSKRLD